MRAERICTAPRASVFLSPKPSSQIETELLYGQSFICREIDGGFAQGEVVSLISNAASKSSMSKGYVRVKDLAPPPAAAPAYKVTSLKAPVFSKKDIKSRIKMVLPFGARLSSLSAHRTFIRIGRGQYVHRRHIGLVSDYAPDFVAVAERHLGLPYIWGGVSSDGLDCSGLVQSALSAAGAACPRNSGEQKDMLGREVAAGADLMRGDLVFWPGHVGIMQDAQNMIHANGYHMCVASETLSAAARRIEKSAGPISAIKRL